MTSEQFQHIAVTIPKQPGIYKYFDSKNELLYVGKAKHLRKRVSSYFTKTFTSYKTHELVQRIDRIEFTIVNSEQDAFLLENTLIKQFQPRFNINLKDDKTYPFIVIKNEPFPRVFLTRNNISDGSEYLGPYTSVKRVRELMEFIKQTIQLRNCSLNLTENNIKRGKFKVCLEYHLGNCKGPCEGLQTLDDYNEEVAQLKNLLRGNLGPVIRHFKDEMKAYSASLSFEKAELVKKKIDFLENYQSRSIVANPRAGNMDVFSILKEKDIAYVNYLMVRNGAIIQTQTNRVETHLDESTEEILSFSIAQLRTTFNSDAIEIVVPFAIEYPQVEIKITIPKAGDRKKLLDLSQKNARHFIEEMQHRERLQLNIKSPDKLKLLKELQRDLQLQELPAHIECFDNSNFQGSYPVSAMVCFKNGEPSKKDYRHFNVKTVEGINDFATMKEAVFRRYKRLKEEEQPFPQLVIIDGGKGQLSAALEAIKELSVEGRTTLVGLAKNEEEIFFSGDKESLKLSYNSNSLKFIRRIRDEVHRFGITFHRLKRSKGTFKNELEKIPGIGKATADTLLKEFKSVKNIRETIRLAESEIDIAKVIGIAKAKVVVSYFKQSVDLKP
ncbi:MAG: excinuclease ABC subunit C [Chitinophagaceae bacterium]|jgi:excinuclease ABC subunit C|nr:excinuclease ABC subunit C [Chitinophagaceae bacterium]MBK7680919.1 excinuclease ABC subunit C [Chitinophagaceae bacterium]MBK8300834.1 excinuclease ABC subunit C [Chitinophagaceae bacterium]MBK9465332.1 excinuclease ABC subunit C [Chitinophagaceae bacterium]MBK9660477.1 excinuclease ABC subunit C [Chitinophagaceae bacterium]